MGPIDLLNFTSVCFAISKYLANGYLNLGPIEFYGSNFIRLGGMGVGRGYRRRDRLLAAISGVAFYA